MKPTPELDYFDSRASSTLHRGRETPDRSIPPYSSPLPWTPYPHSVSSQLAHGGSPSGGGDAGEDDTTWLTRQHSETSLQFPDMDSPQVRRPLSSATLYTSGGGGGGAGGLGGGTGNLSASPRRESFRQQIFGKPSVSHTSEAPSPAAFGMFARSGSNPNDSSLGSTRSLSHLMSRSGRVAFKSQHPSPRSLKRHMQHENSSVSPTSRDRRFHTSWHIVCHGPLPVVTTL